MTFSLDTVPFDLLFEISRYLDVEDVVHLSRTSRQLSILLDEKTLCRQLLEVNKLPAFSLLTMVGAS
jgi:hypothetical protein